jgi:hypothetical protein
MTNTPPTSRVNIPSSTKKGVGGNHSNFPTRRSSLSTTETDRNRRAPPVGSPPMDHDKSGQGPWMETATLGKFHLFQAKIFPIVDAITAKAEYAQH